MSTDISQYYGRLSRERARSDDKPVHIATDELDPHTRDFVLEQQEKNGEKNGYQDAVDFGFKEVDANNKKKRKLFQERIWNLLIRQVYNRQGAYEFTVLLITAAERAVTRAQRHIEKHLDRIGQVEKKLNKFAAQGGDSRIIDDIRDRLSASRSLLEDAQQELVDYQDGTLADLRAEMESGEMVSEERMAEMHETIFKDMPEGAQTSFAEKMQEEIEEALALEAQAKAKSEMSALFALADMRVQQCQKKAEERPVLALTHAMDTAMPIFNFDSVAPVQARGSFMDDLLRDPGIEDVMRVLGEDEDVLRQYMGESSADPELEYERG